LQEGGETSLPRHVPAFGVTATEAVAGCARDAVAATPWGREDL
jgi:hypothetical protein